MTVTAASLSLALSGGSLELAGCQCAAEPEIHRRRDLGTQAGGRLKLPSCIAAAARRVPGAQPSESGAIIRVTATE